MDTKKTRERSILDLIYKGRLHISVTSSEEPDFKLQNTNGEFGVEVTEFYFSHSRARINNIPGYVGDIISNKKYRHKDDIVSLAVSEATIMPNDRNSTSRQIKAIFQKQPPISKYVSKVTDLIEVKNKKFKNYIKGLSHVNLIIFDYENRLVGADKDKFHHLFYLPDLEKIITQSEFREIFFITKIGTFESSKCIYIPLKMLFLLAEIFMFNQILSKEYSKDPRVKSIPDSILCAEYLEWRGARDLSIGEKSNNLEIIYGNSGVFVTEDNKVRIYDYNDFSIPLHTHPFVLQKPSGILDGKFLKLFTEYKNNYIFSTELCFDITKSDPFPLI